MTMATVLSIQGTFDIALARKTLRTKIAARRWPSTFNAYATATLSALGELILLPCVAGLTVIKLDIVEEGQLTGIEFSSSVKLLERDYPQLAEAIERLERASDELAVEETPSGVQINARLWVKKEVA